MKESEVRARVAQLRSDWEAAKRDHTQANATQAGVELLVGFFQDIFKEDETDPEDLPQAKMQAGTGQQPPSGPPASPATTEAPAPPTTTPATPDATGVPGEQKPIEGNSEGTAAAAS